MQQSFVQHQKPLLTTTGVIPSPTSSFSSERYANTEQFRRVDARLHHGCDVDQVTGCLKRDLNETYQVPQKNSFLFRRMMVAKQMATIARARLNLSRLSSDSRRMSKSVDSLSTTRSSTRVSTSPYVPAQASAKVISRKQSYMGVQAKLSDSARMRRGPSPECLVEQTLSATAAQMNNTLFSESTRDASYARSSINVTSSSGYESQLTYDTSSAAQTPWRPCDVPAMNRGHAPTLNLTQKQRLCKSVDSLLSGQSTVKRTHQLRSNCPTAAPRRRGILRLGKKMLRQQRSAKNLNHKDIGTCIADHQVTYWRERDVIPSDSEWDRSVMSARKSRRLDNGTTSCRSSVSSVSIPRDISSLDNSVTSSVQWENTDHASSRDSDFVCQSHGKITSTPLMLAGGHTRTLVHVI